MIFLVSSLVKLVPVWHGCPGSESAVASRPDAVSATLDIYWRVHHQDINMDSELKKLALFIRFWIARYVS